MGLIGAWCVVATCACNPDTSADASRRAYIKYFTLSGCEKRALRASRCTLYDVEPHQAMTLHTKVKSKLKATRDASHG
eukprot:880333-Pleurochrysis_carterae.AAC.2